MSTPIDEHPAGSRRSDAANWAKRSGPLSLDAAPEGALNLNVEGRLLAGPLQGFGKLWQKTYRVALPSGNVSPAEVIAAWRTHYGEFWPAGNRFYAPLKGLEPGEVALINADLPGKLKLSTGVMVLYADETSFTFMTPQGHPFAGWITFSASHVDGLTVAQVEVLMRAQDPMSEIGLTFGGHRAEDRMWEETLVNLAAHFGVEGAVETNVTCIDKKRQWKRVGNIRHDAALHSAAHAATSPVRSVGASWRRVLVAAALVQAIVHLGLQALAGEIIPPLVVFGVLPLVGVGLMPSRERVGAWWIAIVSALSVLGSVPFIAEALAHPESPVEFVHSAWALTASVAAVVAAVAFLRRREGVATWLAAGTLTVAVATLAVGVVAALSSEAEAVVAGDVEVVAEALAWEPAAIEVPSGGTVFVANHDLVRHTFTVDELGIEAGLPPGTPRRVVIGGAAPGEYVVICSVPGHENMTGTLTVTGP